MYDKYGHILYCLRYYDGEEIVEKELKRGKLDNNAGPYTAVLWPPSVNVIGRILK